MRLKIPGSAIFGILLIAVGVVSLLSSLDYINSYDVIRMFWPAVIILFGVKAILDYRSNTFFGLILIAIGGMILIDNLGYSFLGKLSMSEMIIPMIVILIGLNFLLPKGKKDDTGAEQWNDRTVHVEAHSHEVSGATAAPTPSSAPGPASEPAAVSQPVPPAPPTPPVPPAPPVPESAAPVSDAMPDTPDVNDIVVPSVPPTPEYEEVTLDEVEVIVDADKQMESTETETADQEDAKGSVDQNTL